MSIRIGKRITAVIFAAALMTSSGSMVLAAKSTQKTTSSVQKKTVQVTAASGTYYVSSDIGLNVRKGPSTASARIGLHGRSGDGHRTRHGKWKEKRMGQNQIQ